MKKAKPKSVIPKVAKKQYRSQIDRTIIGYAAVGSSRSDYVTDEKGSIIIAAAIEDMENYCENDERASKATIIPFFYGDFIERVRIRSVFFLGGSGYKTYADLNAKDVRDTPLTVFIEEEAGIRLQLAASSSFPLTDLNEENVYGAIVGYYAYSRETLESFTLGMRRPFLSGTHEFAYRFMHEYDGKEYRVELLTYSDFLGRIEAGDVFHLDEGAHAVFQSLRRLDPERKPLIAVVSHEIKRLPCVSVQAAHAALYKPDWDEGSRHIGYSGIDCVTFMSIVDKKNALVLAYSKNAVRTYATEHGNRNQITTHALNLGQVMDIMASGIRFFTDDIVGMKIKDIIDTDIPLSSAPEFIKSSHADPNGMYWWIGSDQQKTDPGPSQELGV